ncbi:uncharacterized protein KIAA2012 homolog isoform X1 [Anolis carolinensis]|uniref:uncharacterized protein KIAA2012 homolog isoform X1 n=1 Tax=Anolis carolinensis TaxID=28377 RepID=UPI002F2B1E59
MSSLSMLSRGAGEVIRNKQEKLEVHFDPEDYVNWTSPETRSHINGLQILEGSYKLCLPKTYSTRTGALILYSEDLAKPSRRWKECRKSRRRAGNKKRALHVELHTLQDLVRAILAYGSKEANKKGTAWQPCLHFLSEPYFRTDRQMRPGYSAKRYLLKLSQTWDPSILQKLQRSGYIRDPWLLAENSGDDRKKQQDLSATPPKYNLLHIFYSPCPYLQTELEEPHIYTAGLGPSFQKQSENKVRLVQNPEEEKGIRERVRIPLRISVRKLSFHLRRQQTKETTWSQDTAYREIPEESKTGVHQDREASKDELGHSERSNKSVNYPTLANTIIDNSDLWSEQSHVTFYGGFLPGRKISYSVSQRHLKNGDGSRPSMDTGLFPPIHLEARSEQGGATKEHKKQVPEILRLPQIPEDSPRVPWKQCAASELSKELVVLPLLVHMGRETQAKVKRLKGTCSNDLQSTTDSCNKHLTLLQNDLILESDHKRQQEQMTGSRITDSSQVSFTLPPINNKDYSLSTKKIRKTEVCSENNLEYEREYHKGTSLSSPIKCPDREIICPSLLGSIQTTDDPRQFGLIPDEEAREAEAPAGVGIVSRSLPEASSEVQEQDGKELLQTQQNGNKNGFKTKQNTAGNGSISVEFRKRNQQSQGGACTNNNQLQTEEEREHFTLPQTQKLKQQIKDDFKQGFQGCELEPWKDTQKKLEDLPQSGSLLHLKPQLVSTSEMESVPKSGNAVKRLLDHSEEIQESTRMGFSSSEKKFGIEEHNMAFSKKTRKQVKDTGLKTKSQAASVLENKSTQRQKKYELGKVGDVSKVHTKNAKKDHHQKQTEFVVGKPRQKKTAGKTVAFPKEKPAGIRKSKTEESLQERRGDADLQQTDSFDDEEGGREQEAGGEDVNSMGGISDQSCPPSTPLQEEHPLVMQEEWPSPEDTAHSSASPVSLPNNKPILLHPVLPIANGSQTDEVHSREFPEGLPQNKEEEKRSREKMIAERAEKRRLAVERKRKEQEDLKRKEQEQQARIERMNEEMQLEKQRRIEEIRLRKQQLEEERHRQQEEAEKKRQAEKAAQERLRQQQEEYRRKLLEIQRKKQEEEEERAEAEKRRQKEREIQLEEERRRLAEMAEEERLEYLKKKQEEEEKTKREAEERRKKAEEEARIALEEERQHALLLARQREELEKQQQFQYKTLVEASGLEREQNISRPWVYSYFQHSCLKVRDGD